MHIELGPAAPEDGNAQAPAPAPVAGAAASASPPPVAVDLDLSGNDLFLLTRLSDPDIMVVVELIQTTRSQST